MLRFAALRIVIGLVIVAAGCATTPDDTQVVQEAITGGQVESGYPAVGCLKASSNGSGCNCTGTLIAPSVVLAAKHCGPMAAFQLGSSDSSHGETQPIDAQIPYHPEEGTGPSTSIYAYDVELLHLKTPIFDVRPLPINTGPVPATGSNCIAVGFGDNSTGGEGTKYSATVHVSWSGALTTLGVTDMASAILIVQGSPTASPPGGMPQHGDSGGPLLCNGVITGVASGTWSYPVMSGFYYTALDSSITFDASFVTNVAQQYASEPLISQTSWSPSTRVDLFGRGTDGALYHKTFDTTLPVGPDGSHWYPSMVDWEYRGGFITGTPEAVSWGPNRIDVFVRGGDSNPQTDAFSSTSLFDHYWNGSSWNWQGPIGNGLASHPVAVSWGPNRLDVFALNSLGTISHFFGTGQITSFEQVPSENGPSSFLPGGMKAFSTSSGNLDLFAIGTDNVLYHAHFNSLGVWTDWDNLGGSVGGMPAVASWGGGREDIFLRATNGDLYQKTFVNNGWFPSQATYTYLGSSLASSPAVASMQPNWLMIMATGGPAAGLLYKGWFNGTEWFPTNATLEPLSGSFAGSPVFQVVASTKMNMFLVDNRFTPVFAIYDAINGPPATYGWSGLGSLFGVLSW